MTISLLVNSGTPFLEVNGIVADWTPTHDLEEVIRISSKGDVPCGLICSIGDIFNEGQFWERDTLMRVTDERLGSLAVQGPLPKLSEILGKIKHLSTTRRRHNAEIFGALLDLGEKAFDGLKAEGVI